MDASLKLTTFLCFPSSSILSVAALEALLFVFSLFMYVVSILIIFLNTFNWHASYLFSAEGISCADSSPYSTLDLNTASAVYGFIAVSQLLCLQQVSIFSIVIMQSANLLDNYSRLFVSILILHPR